MLKKKILQLMVFSFLLLPGSALCDNSTANHPALALMQIYPDDVVNKNTVNPYLVNIIAIYELSGNRHIGEVKKYIEWYFNHLNYPDSHGLTGTIYDYQISADGKEVSTQHYDSVDGYAGTFLYLLSLYQMIAKDDSFIDNQWDKIQDIAYLIPYLQSADGLTTALPQDNNHRKYLMDNCEAYAGIQAFIIMSRRTRRSNPSSYAEIAENIKRGILKILYHQENTNFCWAVDDQTRHRSDWSVFYPDALSQLFPIYYGLLNDDKTTGKRLWREFTKRYKNKSGSFPLEQRMIFELTKKKMHR